MNPDIRKIEGVQSDPVVRRLRLISAMKLYVKMLEIPKGQYTINAEGVIELKPSKVVLTKVQRWNESHTWAERQALLEKFRLAGTTGPVIAPVDEN